jgi:hypothetical protein
MNWYKYSNIPVKIFKQFARCHFTHDLSNLGDMESNSSKKPDLTLSPRVKELLDLESRFTVGGFDPMPYFFEKGQGSLLWVSYMRGGRLATRKFQP